jgi:hypothetical protein
VSARVPAENTGLGQGNRESDALIVHSWRALIDFLSKTVQIAALSPDPHGALVTAISDTSNFA